MDEPVKTQRYYHYSEKASEIARSAGFAGLGAIWIFHNDWKEGALLPKGLAIAASFIVAGLAFDLLQYVMMTFYWARRCAQETIEVDDQRVATKVGFFTSYFLLMKFSFIIVACGLIVWYLGTHIYVLTPRL